MLSISNLQKTYKNDVKALSGINLEIGPGMFGLLGPNGAGKSTLMRTIATLQYPDEGDIRFDSEDVFKDPTSLRKRLGYLPQAFGAYPRTSALTMLKHFAALKNIHGKERDKHVKELLVRTNLWEARNKSVDKYSGGMKQRFGIAQALLGDPELIIVDEPTAGLDPVERRRFQNLLSSVSKDVVIILSTHIVDDVSELCSKMAILGNGKILKEGTPSELTASLNGSIWNLYTSAEDIPRIRENHTVLSTRFCGGKVEIRVLADSAPDNMTPATVELEDVYFSTLLEHEIDVTVD